MYLGKLLVLKNWDKISQDLPGNNSRKIYTWKANWPAREILVQVLIASVSSKGSDEAVHIHSLTRAFASSIHKVWK